MKHLNFILAGLFFLCGLCCRAQVLPLEENVVLNTKEGQIKGKLLLPGGVKTCPVVLIIAGSGPTDMDGNSAIGNLRNNSLKFLAEGLAANGIASLRFDKRGIGTSASAGKEESKLRFEDYVNDVTGWIDYLAKEKRFTTITVAGHSEGALIGMLACQNRPKVKGYISVAGAGRPAYEIIEAQVAAQQNPEAVRKEVASINGSLKNGKEVSDVPAYLQSLYRASVQPYFLHPSSSNIWDSSALTEICKRDFKSFTSKPLTKNASLQMISEGSYFISSSFNFFKSSTSVT